jgi:hypothetical protein
MVHAAAPTQAAQHVAHTTEPKTIVGMGSLCCGKSGFQ